MKNDPEAQWHSTGLVCSICGKRNEEKWGREKQGKEKRGEKKPQKKYDRKDPILALKKRACLIRHLFVWLNRPAFVYAKKPSGEANEDQKDQWIKLTKQKKYRTGKRGKNSFNAKG